MIVASNEKGTLSWYENNQSSFTRHLVSDSLGTLHFADEQNTIQTTDINTDGNPDLVVMSSDSSISRYENSGGSFDSGQVVKVLPFVREILTGDLDNDNEPELVYGADGVLAYHDNDSNGFTADSTHIGYSSCSFCYFQSISMSDIDQDGNQDIVAADGDVEGEVNWYQNNGDGSFSAANLIAEDNFDALQADLIDIDFDGDQDVVVNSANTFGELRWYENTDSGFSDANQLLEGQFLENSDVEISDIDEDSDPDMVYASETYNQIKWIENTDFGSFNRNPVSKVPSFNGLSQILTADFTGNNQTDVALLFARTDQIAWIEQTDQGFSEPRVVDNIRARTLHAADMNGNGNVDLLTSTLSDSLKIYLNSGTDLGKRFSNEVVVSDSTGRVTELISGDLDGDEDLDIVSFEYTDNAIKWYENQTTGFSAPNLVTDNASSVWDIVVRDLDQDGNPDIISALTSSDEIAWFKNQDTSLGDRFGSKIVISDSADGATAIDVTDLDNDNDPDVLSASEATNGSKFAWYDNQGDQISSQKILLETSNSSDASGIKTADLNDNGYPEVIAQDDSTLMYFENQQGSFAEPTTVDQEYSGSGTFVTADVNQDVAPDILAAYSDLDRLVWYQNNFDYTPIPGEKGPETPEQFGLTQNYPNPFNPTTKIGFKLPQVSEVTLTVYNVLGQKVSTLVDRRIKSGRHTVTFDGSSLSSGVYTYRLKAGNFTETRKMLLIK